MAAWDADPIVVKAGAWDNDPIATPAAPTNTAVNATNVARSFSRGVPVIGGLLDEANAATNAALDPAAHAVFGTPQIPGASFGERYTNELATQRGMDQGFDSAHPYVSTGAQLAGGLASGGALAKAAPAASAAIFGVGDGALPAQIATGAGKGALLGGADAFTRGEGGFDARVDNAKTGAEVGGVVGAAAPAIAAGVGRVFGTRPSPIPSTEDLKAISDAKYGPLRGTQVPLNAKAIDALQGDHGDAAIKLALQGAAANRDTATAKELEGLLASPVHPLTPGQTISVNALDAIHQAFGEQGSGAVNNGNKYVGSGLFDRAKDLDTVFDQTPALADARASYAHFKRSETIDGVVKRAQDAAIGTDNFGPALRSSFKKLVSDPSALSRFSPEEQDAFRSIAEGTLTSKGLKTIAGLGNGMLGNLVAVGSLVHGDLEGMAPKAIGGAAEKMGSVLAARQATAAAQQVRNGAPVGARQFSSQGREDTIRRLLSTVPALNGFFGR